MERYAVENKRTRLMELDYFNGICCLLVILIHVLSLGITSLEAASWQLCIVYLPWRLAAFVVPGFLFTGAVKMAQQLESRAMPLYPKYILSRAGRVYLPYLAYTLVYFFVFVAIGYISFSPKDLLTYLLTGDISAQFYYVILVMQFYLLLPLWKWMLRRIPWYVAIFTSAMLSLAMLKASDLFSLWGIDFPYCDRIVPTYIFFWVLGLYVGKYYGVIRETITGHGKPILICGIGVTAFALMTYLQYRTGIYVYDAGYLKLFSDGLSILILLYLCLRLAERPAGRLHKMLASVHHASYSVYLSHCLFLTVGTFYLQGWGVRNIGVLLILRAIICYTLPFLLYFCGQRILRCLCKKK